MMMAKFKSLKAPKGTDEANFDGQSYRVDNNGDVSVPAEAVEALLKTGGFVAEDESGPLPVGNVRMVHSSDASGCSWGGVSYEAGASGAIEVPAEAVTDLEGHGFVVAPEKAASKTLSIPQLKITK